MCYVVRVSHLNYVVISGHRCVCSASFSTSSRSNRAGCRGNHHLQLHRHKGHADVRTITNTIRCSHSTLESLLSMRTRLERDGVERCRPVLGRPHNSLVGNLIQILTRRRLVYRSKGAQFVACATDSAASDWLRVPGTNTNYL